jgi:transcriptional regulator with XRE-family HTH domain
MYNNYGKAFKTIRLIKGIQLSQAADELNIDERTLRKIEDGETDIITPRFEQLLNYYAVEYNIVFELIKDQPLPQNIIRTIKGNDTVVNQNQVSVTEREKLISSLEAQIEQLKINDKFQKEIIERLLSNKGE